MPDQAAVHCNLECVADMFRPRQLHAVRWLDVEADYPLARGFWAFPISPADWRGFRDDGYQYCAVVEDGRIVSIGAIWRYSDHAWELVAVSTRPKFRRQGYGQSVASVVTAAILSEGRRATCLTAADNVAMQRTAESLGFYRAERR
jgi:RimJ/RimL family protein N-acetyltransferase